MTISAALASRQSAAVPSRVERLANGPIRGLLQHADALVSPLPESVLSLAAKSALGARPIDIWI
jgi:hypothetical protein